MLAPAKRLLSRALARAGYQISATQLGELPIELDGHDRRILDDVRRNELTMTPLPRLLGTLMACRHVCERAIAGDFVECGVWRGGNSILAADLFKRLAPTRTVHLFDTFAGMTEPTAQDVPRGGGPSARDKYFSTLVDTRSDWCYASLEEVRGHFDARALLAQARFHQGDVALTLTASDGLPEKIAVLRLDTDWYESTKLELEVLYPRLSQGGILIVDDYGYWGGARQAVDEYFRDRPRPFLQYVDHSCRMGTAP